MKMRKQLALWALTSATAVGSLGCSAWSPATPRTEKSWKPSTWFKKEFQEPASVATIWKADTIAEPGQPGQRGFGARVYFYNERSQAIPIEGDLVIHGFLTTPSSRKSPNDQADKKFTFSEEQLASQYSPSDLGASYSIWVPWDTEGGFREEITLVATFKSKKGTVVQGAPSRLFLPGKPRYPEALSLPDEVQQISYQKHSFPTYGIDPTPSKTATRITTIEVPRDAQLGREPEGVSVGGNQMKSKPRASTGFPVEPKRTESANGQVNHSLSGPAVSPRDDLGQPGYQMQTLPPAPQSSITGR